MPIKKLEEQHTLVIAGAWNPAILSPNWVAKEILGLPFDNGFQVGMQFPINDPSQPIGFQFHDIAYQPALNVLIFFFKPEIDGQIQKTIDAAAKILELLPHTPISGVGFNSAYSVSDAHEDLLKMFSAGSQIPAYLEDADAQLVQHTWGASVLTHQRLINIGAKLEGGNVAISFNVHIEVESASLAAIRLRTPNLVEDIEKDINTVVKNITKEELP